MSDAFAAMVDVLFADPNMARDAVYMPAGSGAATPVRVMVRRPDVMAEPFGISVVAGTMRIEVRMADVEAPAVGDTFEIGGTVHTINAQPRRDIGRLVWEIEAVEK